MISGLSGCDGIEADNARHAPPLLRSVQSYDTRGNSPDSIYTQNALPQTQLRGQGSSLLVVTEKKHG